MSGSVMHLDLLLRIPLDHVLFDFLAQCGLRLCAAEPVESEAASEASTDDRLRIVAAIERAPSPIRDGIVASLRHVALLADAAGLAALRAVSGVLLGLPETPAHCALWMYRHHRALFDAAMRTRGLHTTHVTRMPLESLRQPLALPDDLAVDRVRLFEATLLDETTGGELAVKAPACHPTLSVLDVLNAWMPSDNPMRQGRFRVVAATLGVELFPEPGQTLGRSVMLILKRRGGSNLSDFDARTRTHLETWLRHWQLSPGDDSNVPRASVA